MSVSPETMPCFAPTEFDGWVIRVEPLDGGGEVFDLPMRTVIVDPGECRPDRARDHVVAHLRLKHHLDSPDQVFTEAQEDEADAHAEFMRAAVRKAWTSIAASAWALTLANLPTLQKTTAFLAS